MTPSSAHSWEFNNESDLRKWNMQNAIMKLQKYILKLYLKSTELDELKLNLKLSYEAVNDLNIEVYSICQLIFSLPTKFIKVALAIVNLLIFSFSILNLFEKIQF